MDGHEGEIRREGREVASRLRAVDGGFEGASRVRGGLGANQQVPHEEAVSLVEGQGGGW